MQGKRKETARNPFAYIEDITLESFVEPYVTFRTDYNKCINSVRKRLTKAAYISTFNNNKELVFISFHERKRYLKDVAKGIAVKYFKENGHPDFSGKKWRDMYLTCRARRIPEFDKYSDAGTIPIIELMRLGVSFSCYLCGKGNFHEQDVKNERCFIIEGEGNLNPFTRGFVVCRRCMERA